MKVIQLQLPVQAKRWKEQRCCRRVRSTGTTYFKGDNTRCGRMARFKINGIALCTQHAGEYALHHLLQNQNSEE